MQFQLLPLFFFTFVGAFHPPPCGFISQPTITFHTENQFPKANTCTNTMFLPVGRPLLSRDQFVYNMAYGILNAAGFGRV